MDLTKGDSKMKKNDRVIVYLDPFTVSDVEGAGTVVTTPDPVQENDDKGRPMYRACVRFDDEEQSYFRTISEKESV
jgi:hypothetical protein